MHPEQLGRYEILSELGQGAMGVVYKAVDPVIDRTVAIKTISLNLPKDELADFEERFFREAKSAGRLNHPNIVTIYDAGKAEQVAFIAMEFLEGRELKEIMASGEPLSLDRIVEIVCQVADGLAFAHQHGVVHRDIKPANIMVLKNGLVKITDFGIAKMQTGAHTQVGIVLGSPKYMSPEQVLGKAVDGRSDIFSLGAVLYELLTGQNAFGGDDLTAIMYRVLHETPPMPSALKPGLPPAFDYIVGRALNKEPEARYQTAGEMAEDLRHYQKLAIPKTSAPATRAAEDVGEATLVLPAHPVAAPVPPGRKWPWAIGAVLLITAVALVVVLILSKEVPEQASAPVPSPEQVQPAPSKATQATPEKERPQATATIPARLSLAVTPWGEVFIDGKRQGIAPPLNEIKLSPGRHTVEIRNGDFPAYKETVELQAGSTRKIKHRFR